MCFSFIIFTLINKLLHQCQTFLGGSWTNLIKLEMLCLWWTSGAHPSFHKTRDGEEGYTPEQIPSSSHCQQKNIKQTILSVLHTFVVLNRQKGCVFLPTWCLPPLTQGDMHVFRLWGKSSGAWRKSTQNVPNEIWARDQGNKVNYLN